MPYMLVSMMDVTGAWLILGRAAVACQDLSAGTNHMPACAFCCCMPVLYPCSTPCLLKDALCCVQKLQTPSQHTTCRRHHSRILPSLCQLRISEIPLTIS
jgi:hypothetical protein